MNEGAGGESGESLPNDGKNASQEMDQVKFLESLVSHYESLVTDMNMELINCRNDLKACNEKMLTSNSEKHCMDKFQNELCRRDTFIEYLREQLKISRKSKDVLKNLWQSTVQQIEVLEIQKAKGLRTTGRISGISSVSPDFLTQWKILQAYANNLENRLEKYTKETSFYRNKVMENRVQYETVLKKQAVEKAREIQHTKSSYIKEIEYLRSSLDRLAQDYQQSLQKRLKAERDAWEFQENTRLQTIKLNVERLVLNNEALKIREAEQKALIMKMDIELRSVKMHQSPSFVSAPMHCNGTTATVQSEHKKYKGIQIQTDFEYISPDQFQKLKISQEQLQTEYQKLLPKLQLSENDSLNMRKRLQCRIHELENINSNLQSRVIEFADQKKYLEPLKNADSHQASVTQNKVSKSPAKNQFRSWKEDFTLDKVRAEDYQLNINIIKLNQEMRRLHADRIKLLEIIEKQKNIASKWKAEFKELAKRLIP